MVGCNNSRYDDYGWNAKRIQISVTWDSGAKLLSNLFKISLLSLIWYLDQISPTPKFDSKWFKTAKYIFHE